MCDCESTTVDKTRNLEIQYHTRMKNTSWQMPRAAMQELEEELYQKNVDEKAEEHID